MSKKLARRTSRCDTKRVVGCVSLLEYSEISRGVSRGTDHVVFHSSCRLPQACIFVSKFFPPDFFKGSLFFFPPGFDSHTRPPCRAWWLAPRGSNPSIHACHLSSALASASPMKFFLGSSLFFTLLKKKITLLEKRSCEHDSPHTEPRLGVTFNCGCQSLQGPK